MLDRLGGSRALSPRRFTVVTASVAIVTAALTAPVMARADQTPAVNLVTETTTIPNPTVSAAPDAVPTTVAPPQTPDPVATTAAPVLEANGYTVSRAPEPSWSVRRITACGCTLTLPWRVSSERDVTLPSGTAAHVVLSEQPGAGLSAAVWTTGGGVDTADIVNALSVGATATTTTDGSAVLVTLRSSTSTARAKVLPTASGTVVMLVASTTSDPIAEFNRVVASYRAS